MDRPDSAAVSEQPRTVAGAAAGRPAQPEEATRRPLQSGSVQRSGVPSAPRIERPRTAEPSRRPQAPEPSGRVSSEFGNPAGNWLG